MFINNTIALALMIKVRLAFPWWARYNLVTLPLL
jgi:hypothetical protein